LRADGHHQVTTDPDRTVATAGGRTRSVVLAVNAVVLNVLSLTAAFGIVVFVLQQGHGSSLWGIEATQSIIAYIPAMIFAFLYGISMDYEVFMLSRMRESI